MVRPRAPVAPRRLPVALGVTLCWEGLDSIYGYYRADFIISTEVSGSVEHITSQVACAPAATNSVCADLPTAPSKPTPYYKTHKRNSNTRHQKV